MSRTLRTLFVLVIAGLLIFGPIAYSNYRQAELHGFRVVREGVLYRSGQMSLAGLKRVLREYNIKTVVSLRYAKHAGERPPDWQEERLCNSQEVNYRRIKLDTWWASDGSVPAEKGVRRFRKIMDDRNNYPVLIHCFAGLHRTGACCAIYRMEYQRWPNGEAIDEMKECGYRNIDDEYDLLGYLEQYQPRWKAREKRSAKHPRSKKEKN